MEIIHLSQRQCENAYYSILVNIEHEIVSHHTWISTCLVHPVRQIHASAECCVQLL